MLLIALITDSRVKFLPAALMPATSSMPFCQPTSACSVGACPAFFMELRKAVISLLPLESSKGTKSVMKYMPWRSLPYFLRFSES